MTTQPSKAGNLALGAEFATPTHDEWIELATKVLKGKAPDSLTVTTADGIAIAPLYVSSDPAPDRAGLPGAPPFTRGSAALGRTDGAWDVRQQHDDPDLGRANQAILDDLERGATSLVLDVDRLGFESAADLEALLNGVFLDLIGVQLTGSIGGLTAATQLVDVWKKSAVPASALTGNLGADPLGVAAGNGTEADLSLVVAAAELCVEFDSVRPLMVDTTVYADAGASDAQQLAYSLATGVAYLRALTNAGASVDDACAAMAFRFSLDTDQFAGIAKLRAARRTWARVCEASGAVAQGQEQNAVTASAMMTTADPWVNLLRVTVATFAAATGGADSITTQPFDSALGISDDFARRLARNTQLLLLEESNLGRVVDPAGGSWYVEELTDDLAARAWEIFQELEAVGGMASALSSGLIAEQISDSAAHGAERVAKRKSAITGVSEFPNIDEVLPERQARPAETTDGLALHRRSEPFERLRAGAASAEQEPTIFLANLGTVAQHTARATYAQNFFEVAGIRGVTNHGFATAAETADAFAESGAQLAVICSADPVYVELAESAAAALKAGGATRVYLAGRPGDNEPAWSAAGVDEYIHIGVNVLDILGRALSTLGISTDGASN